MAYYKVRIEVWCDLDPAKSDFEEIAENISAARPFARSAKWLPLQIVRRTLKMTRQ